MATYPIKMLKDEENKPFVPLVSTDCIRDENNQTLQQVLDKKLSPTNLLAGDYVSIATEGNNCYINVDLPANLDIINNLTTTSAGQGALDAYQGKVLKDSIPQVVNDLSSTSTTSALSAAQGKALNDKINSLSIVANTGSYNDLIDKPERVDYISQITCSYGTLNSNFNYCFLKDNIVYLNLSYTLNTALTAGTQYDFCKIPESVRPKGNVIMYAFSHQTSHMIASYIRSTGELVITPEKAVPSGKEINIWAVYYIK